MNSLPAVVMRETPGPARRPRREILTAQQETFCLAYIRLGIGYLAYIEAYKVKDDTPKSTLYPKASALLAKAKIRARIDALRNDVAKVNIDSILLEYDQNRNHALEYRQIGAANGAVTGKARVVGLIPRTSEGTAHGTTINVYLLAEDKTVG